MDNVERNQESVGMKQYFAVGLCVLCLSMIVVNLSVGFRAATYPSIHGVILAEAKELPMFSVLDQNQQSFTQEALKGRWHLISYGFTSCADVCPTIMTKLNKVYDVIAKENRMENFNVIFYSVDAERDTPSVLKQYLQFFNARFIGLVPVDTDYMSRDLNKRSDAYYLKNGLESGLGLRYQKMPEDAETGYYEVTHGVELYLINPNGKLQAIIKPTENGPGEPGFLSSAVIAHDILRVMDFMQVSRRLEK
ncbi:SCO1 protein [Thalassocella blandensis]|nr:SCO1 protein [Thalassocella blandensis]